MINTNNTSSNHAIDDAWIKRFEQEMENEPDMLAK